MFVIKIKKNTEFKGVLKLLTGTIHISYLVTIVTFIRDSSDIFQLKESPFTKPETITNISTSTLMAVKILLTHADSLTPKERRPEKNGHKKTCGIVLWHFRMVGFVFL